MINLKMKHLLTIATSLYITPFVALGQCATGVNTGGGNCIPPDAAGMPGYQGGYAGPARPMPMWADSFGAIALDDDAGSAGMAVNKDTREEAARSAMHDCELGRTGGCKVAITYRNQCAAIAWGKYGRGVARYATERRAKRYAMRACKEKTTECKIVYSACIRPRRIR